MGARGGQLSGEHVWQACAWRQEASCASVNLQDVTKAVAVAHWKLSISAQCPFCTQAHCRQRVCRADVC